MKYKKYIVKSEEQYGFPHGDSEPIHSNIWSIEKTPCVEYSESIESMSKEEIFWFGLYAINPTNIFNKKTGKVRTLSYMSSRLWTHSNNSDFFELTKNMYPIYNINNQYIGYVDKEKTYYTSLYKAHNNKHLAWIIDNKSILSTVFLYIIILIALFVK